MVARMRILVKCKWTSLAWGPRLWYCLCQDSDADLPLCFESGPPLLPVQALASPQDRPGSFPASPRPQHDLSMTGYNSPPRGRRFLGRPNIPKSRSLATAGGPPCAACADPVEDVGHCPARRPQDHLGGPAPVAQDGTQCGQAHPPHQRHGADQAPQGQPRGRQRKTRRLAVQNCEAQLIDLERDIAKLEDHQRALLEALQGAPPAPLPEQEEPESRGEQTSGARQRGANVAVRSGTGAAGGKGPS